MFIEKPNTNNTVNRYNWSDIKKDVDRETPKERDFEDVYDSTDINKDINKVKKIKEKLGIKKELGISDSRIQEYAVQQEIGEMDWFSEGKRYTELFPDDHGSDIVTSLSSEYDDFVNHIDMICVINNSDSDFKPVPFAIDVTYNQDEDGLDKKFSWQHPVIKQAGFATAKYFEDTDSFGGGVIEKGAVPIMPRFIIGFSPELSEQITKQRMLSSTTWDVLARDELSAKAKWCVLTELKAQSEQMLDFLNEHHAESEMLEVAHSQVKALDKYFSEAIDVSAEEDKDHPNWRNYANRDEVVDKILCRNIISG